MLGILTSLKLLLAGASALTAGGQIKSAASNEGGSYVSDMRIIYASSEDGARNLLPEGYELATKEMLYEYTSDSNGNSYLAIKRTNDLKEAITDVRAMNMVGGWSVNSYENLLTEQAESIGKLIDQIQPSINEFRTKYDEAIAKRALGIETGTSYGIEILNSLHNEDILGDNGKPITMTDMLLSDTYATKDNLITVFMQGNTKATFSIQTALIYSSVDLNDDPHSSFNLEDIEDNYGEEGDYIGCDYLDPIPDNEVANMIDNMSSLKETLSCFEKSGFAENGGASFTEENIKTYLSCLPLADAIMFQTGAELYAYLYECTYNGGNLADFVLDFDPEDPSFDRDIVKPFLLEMSTAQRGSYAYSGFANLLMASLNVQKTTEMTDGSTQPYMNLLVNDLHQQMQESGSDSVSVYCGVDRRVFEAEGIALTSQALRQNASKNDYDWFRTNEELEEVLDTVVKACLISSGVLLGCFFLVYGGAKAAVIYSWGRSVFREVFSQCTFGGAVRFWAKEPIVTKGIENATRNALIYNNPMKEITEYEIVNTCKCLSKYIIIADVALALASVAIAVVLIVELAKAIIHLYEEESIVYEAVPEMMVDERVVNDKPTYSYYYNVQCIDKSGGIHFGDITQAPARHQSQWVALYYTKDAACGEAIMADSFQVITNSEQSIDETGLYKFGEQGLYSYTKYTKNDAPVRYLAYDQVDVLTSAKRDAIENIQFYAASLFEVALGNVSDIVSLYELRINDAHNTDEVDELLAEALIALNMEKLENYDVVYPVVKMIDELGEVTLESKVNVQAARAAYDALEVEQRAFVTNYNVLCDAEAKIASLELDVKKQEALEDLSKYILNTSNLGSEAEQQKLYEQCMPYIMDATSETELANGLAFAKTLVDKESAKNKSAAASTFGEGNLGLLFIGLGGGLILGGVGVWVTLRLLKKKETKPSEDNAQN